MKAAVFERFGDPAEVLQVREVPKPEPRQGQVRVRMIASPINPSDIMTIRGQYGKLPRLPATPGYEGVGVVEANGGGLLGRMAMGKRVAVINGHGGNWAEYVAVPAKQAVRVPSDLTDEQVATFFVNPATALVMTRDVLRVPRGAWLLQTAAGSTLGRMVIRLAKTNGFHTINVVRRREQADELRALGADATICTADEAIEERVREITGGVGVRFALDCVGGETGSAVVRSLAAGGRLLLYGTLADDPLTINSRTLMVGQKQVEGFWLSEWAQRASIPTMLSLFRRVGRLIRDGTLAADIGPSFPLDRITEAVQRSTAVGRQGKILLRIGSG